MGQPIVVFLHERADQIHQLAPNLSVLDPRKGIGQIDPLGRLKEVVGVRRRLGFARVLGGDGGFFA